jgi:hypothetical protein
MSENEHTHRVASDVVGRIDIEKQIVLPWSKALQMTRENIFVRLGRSAITASGIFLGIAFLTAVLFGAAAARLLAAMDLERLGLEHSAGELQARIVWLAAMSLVVATVGIVNSMLMSVTERYKEIGTYHDACVSRQARGRGSAEGLGDTSARARRGGDPTVARHRVLRTDRGNPLRFGSAVSGLESGQDAARGGVAQ